MQSRELDIYSENGSLCNLCGFALGSYLSRYTVLMNSKKGETAVHHRSCFIGSYQIFGVSKRLSLIINLISFG